MTSDRTREALQGREHSVAEVLAALDQTEQDQRTRLAEKLLAGLIQDRAEAYRLPPV